MHDVLIVFLTLILPFLLLAQIKIVILRRKQKHNCQKSQFSFPIFSIIGLIMSDFDCGGCDSGGCDGDCGGCDSGGCDGGGCDCGDCSGCSSSNNAGCCDCCIYGLFVSDSSCYDCGGNNTRQENQRREKELERQRFDYQQKSHAFDRYQTSQERQVLGLRKGEKISPYEEEQLVVKLASQGRKTSINWISMVSSIPYERVYEILNKNPNFIITDGFVTLSSIGASTVDIQSQTDKSIDEQMKTPNRIYCPTCQVILENPEIIYCPNCGTLLRDK